MFREHLTNVCYVNASSLKHRWSNSTRLTPTSTCRIEWGIWNRGLTWDLRPTDYWWHRQFSKCWRCSGSLRRLWSNEKQTPRWEWLIKLDRVHTSGATASKPFSLICTYQKITSWRRCATCNWRVLFSLVLFAEMVVNMQGKYEALLSRPPPSAPQWWLLSVNTQRP